MLIVVVEFSLSVYDVVYVAFAFECVVVADTFTLLTSKGTDAVYDTTFLLNEGVSVIAAPPFAFVILRLESVASVDAAGVGSAIVFV